MQNAYSEFIFVLKTLSDERFSKYSQVLLRDLGTDMKKVSTLQRSMQMKILPENRSYLESAFFKRARF